MFPTFWASPEVIEMDSFMQDLIWTDGWWSVEKQPHIVDPACVVEQIMSSPVIFYV